MPPPADASPAVGARPRRAPQTDRAVSDLETCDRAALLVLWTTLHGTPAPRSISRPMLVRILAFDLQTAGEGGLPRDLLRKLAALRAGAAPRPSAPRLRPGRRLLREWAGVTHVVEVTADGWLGQGRRWRSLSAIARAITGAHWSGPRFFGTGQPGRTTATPAPRRRRASASSPPSVPPGTPEPAPATDARIVTRHATSISTVPAPQRERSVADPAASTPTGVGR